MTTEVSVDQPSVRMWPTSRWAEHSSAQDEECQHQTADMQTKLLTHCPVSDTQSNQLAWSVLSATSVLTKVWRFLTLTCRNRAHRHSRRTLRHIAQSRTPTPATQRWPKKTLKPLQSVSKYVPAAHEHKAGNKYRSRKPSVIKNTNNNAQTGPPRKRDGASQGVCPISINFYNNSTPNNDSRFK